MSVSTLLTGLETGAPQGGWESWDWPGFSVSHLFIVPSAETQVGHWTSGDLWSWRIAKSLQAQNTLLSVCLTVSLHKIILLLLWGSVTGKYGDLHRQCSTLGLPAHSASCRGPQQLPPSPSLGIGGNDASWGLQGDICSFSKGLLPGHQHPLGLPPQVAKQLWSFSTKFLIWGRGICKSHGHQPQALLFLCGRGSTDSGIPDCPNKRHWNRWILAALCAPLPSPSAASIWEHYINAESQKRFPGTWNSGLKQDGYQAYWIGICHSIRSPGDPCALEVWDALT